MTTSKCSTVKTFLIIAALLASAGCARPRPQRHARCRDWCLKRFYRCVTRCWIRKTMSIPQFEVCEKTLDRCYLTCEREFARKKKPATDNNNGE